MDTENFNFNASIIARHVEGFVKMHPDLLPNGKPMTPSTAFLLLCMRHKLDLTPEEAADAYTNGGNDAGIDGFYMTDADPRSVHVTLFQSKYHDNTDGDRAFPENAARQIIGALDMIFDPARDIIVNDRLAPKVEEVRSLIGNGAIPRVQVALCNNGAIWNKTAERWINKAMTQYPGQVKFFHFNHDDIIHILHHTKSVDATLFLSGRMIAEDLNFLRMAIGRISARQIADLFEKHGDLLLQRNVRRYLGLHKNGYINADIAHTLLHRPADFYFCNNGVTVVCDHAAFNAMQGENCAVQLTNMQIINGGQTCKTIHQVLQSADAGAAGEEASVMLRVYQIPEKEQDLVNQITAATNSQNPVDLRDLRSNDSAQKTLEKDIADLQTGYAYKRTRDNHPTGTATLTSALVAEAVLAIWREKPHLARFARKQHFGQLYRTIFADLTAAQAVLAALILREVENERKRPKRPNPPLFLPYASHFIAMLMGRILLQKLGIALDDIPKQDCKQLLAFFQENKDALYAEAIKKVEHAVADLLNGDAHSLQKLAATFRRADLLGRL